MSAADLDDPDQADQTEPPVVGRIEPFCGAVGTGRFKVQTRAEPTRVQVGEPLAFTVAITALGKWQQPPRRPDLADQPAYAEFVKNFLIENGPDRFGKQGPTWEFDYRLRPRREGVRRIPSLPLVYFRPGLLPDYKGYMMTEAPPIPLTVLPRPEVTAAEVKGAAAPDPFPDSLYQFAEGPSVLSREGAFVLPPPAVLVLLLLAPPAAGAAWFFLWRYRYPDAARQARRQRTRAARQALAALRAAGNGRNGELAGEAAAILALYLRQRLGLKPVQPTPAEAAGQLRQAGCSADLAIRVVEFLEACDAARYAPKSAAFPSDLAADAGRLVLALEAEPCLSRDS